ncbi:hypothetical protein Tco_0139929 [Tanacetum coccineum]
MDDLNITMEEYIRLEKEKARNHGKVFNWETAKYGKIWYDEDVHDLRSIEIKFLAIAFNDQISSEKHSLVNLWMDDPNITMEEYIRLEEEKAQNHGKVFNWETAKYGKIWYDKDVHDLRSVEIKFLAIALNDQISSEKHFLVNPWYQYGISWGMDMAYRLPVQF